MMGRSLWVGLGGLTLGMAMVFAVLHSSPSSPPGRSPLLFSSSAQAQVSVIIGDRWRRVYDRVPELSLENTYVNRETKKVDPEDTLVKRLMRYHMYSRGRSPLYRLDWKLTLGDYLGLNETIPIETYPGSSALTENPRRGDMAAIAHLNREQRQRLVETLVDVFTPDTDPEPTTQPTPSPAITPTTPPSGSASDLL